MKKKLMLGAGALVVVLLLLGAGLAFLFLGSIVKAGVEKAGPMVTKVPVKLDGATLSVFSGAGTLKGFELGNPEGFKTPHAIRVGTVAMAVDPGSVFRDKVVVRSIRVEAPEITFETDLRGNNLSKILANVREMAGTNQTAATAEGGKGLQVDEFVITGGRINLSATILGGRSGTLALPEIRLSNLGQGPEGITPAELTEKALAAVLAGTVKAVSEGAAALGKEGAELARQLGSGALDAVKKAGGDGAQAVEKIGTGIGNLFKKEK